MSDFNERAEARDETLLPPATDSGGSEQAGERPATEGANGTWRAEAGRKGAHRVHELIQAGKQYEKEHGLKSGRQRLRQLIELGKLYEEQHGLRPARPERTARQSRIEREELLNTLLHCLVRIAKPSYRSQLTRLVEALQGEHRNGHAA